MMTQTLFGEENEMTAKDILCDDKGVIMRSDQATLSVRKLRDRYQVFMYEKDEDGAMISIEFFKEYAEALRDYLTKSLETDPANV